MQTNILFIVYQFIFYDKLTDSYVLIAILA